jgi:nucleotide-binding universal stress UspA family protein
VHDYCEARLEIRTGRAHEQILHLAGQENARVIVMGVHGRGRGVVQRFFLGSVTNQVVRGAACPVLSVRAVTPPASRPAAAS